MKKLVWLAAAGLLVLPVWSAENPVQEPAPDQVQGAVVPGDDGARHEAFQKARKEQMKKMKATREKAEKLVKEYKGLKAGKKKEAKKQEIIQLVASIHEEQMRFKENQLAQFEKRLNFMKEEFAKENTPQAKQQWADKKVEELIENNGDIKVVFGPGKPGPREMVKPNGKKGPRGDGKRDPKGLKGKGPHDFAGGERGMLPPPPVEQDK
jgi:hypothetical protein